MPLFLITTLSEIYMERFSVIIPYHSSRMVKKSYLCLLDYCLNLLRIGATSVWFSQFSLATSIYGTIFLTIRQTVGNRVYFTKNSSENVPSVVSFSRNDEQANGVNVNPFAWPA